MDSPLGSILLTSCLALAASAAGTKVPDFRLLDQAGRSHELYRYADAKAIVLISQGNGCSILRQSVPELKALRDRFAPQGAVFLMINANPQDDRSAIAQEAREYGLDIPVLKDEAQVVARSLGLERTAEALVIDPAGWSLVYRGAIDDRLGYGTQKPQASRRYLRDALQALLAGRPVEAARTDALGCLISLTQSAPPSYAKDVAPLLLAKCAGCHSGPDSGTWALKDYEQVKGWAPMIRESLLTGRMPPWQTDPAYGRFDGDIALSSADLKSLVAWFDAGAPRGEGADPLKRERRAAAPRWPLGEPDMILKLPKQEIPAAGPSPIRYVGLSPRTIPNDLWLSAVDVRPGNRAILHHAVLYFLPRPLDGGAPRFREEGFRKDSASALWAAGTEPKRLPEGVAQFVAAGSYPTLELHYTPTGKPETDETEVGLYLHRGKARPKRLKLKPFMEWRFKIPPRTKDVEVRMEALMERDAEIIALRPHMHYRGQRMRFTARYPDGGSETLLSVPQWDFNWQRQYALRTPKRVAAGTRIVVDGAFDNSPQNPANPDPSQWVTFGPQSSSEMFVGMVFYVDED